MNASEILEQIAPQFNDDDSRDFYLLQATEQTSSSAFGSKYYYAIALRAAHLMTQFSVVTSTGGLAYGGTITSEKEGDLSRSFGGGSTGSNTYNVALGTTTYGQQLDALIKSTVVRACVVT